MVVFQVLAYAHEDTSVVIRGLDELGNPTVGTFSITQRKKVVACWYRAVMLRDGANCMFLL